MIEISVSSNTAMPKGYGFLPKGNQYKTLHCRKLTHEAAKPLYVVVEKKNPIGLRVPAAILHQVHAQAKQTLDKRRAAVQKRDEADMTRAAAEMIVQFPNIPERDKTVVLRHGFKKSSGRVGRTTLISLSQKVLFAVIAHVRHQHTDYDELLRKDVARLDARKSTRGKVESVLKLWGYSKGANRAK